VATAELGRPHLVKENERADHLPHPRRQHTTNLETAEVAGAGYNDCFYWVGPIHVAERAHDPLTAPTILRL
jgi:hypothetical protein